MSFNEYKNEVAKELTKYGYTKDEISKYISRPNIDKAIRVNYGEYSDRKTAGTEPSATASCLDMMYE